MDKAPKNSTPGKVAHIWRIERFQIDEIKFSPQFVGRVEKQAPLKTPRGRLDKVWKDANLFS